MVNNAENAKPVSPISSAIGYAGDIEPNEAWRILCEEALSTMVDVRTTAEWSFVGVPDLSELSKEPFLIEWQTYPDLAINPGFSSMLANSIPDKNTSVIFICRSGARSANAASVMTSLGYSRCFNLAGGFEGDLNSEGHRNNVNGWKISGLPWKQS